MRTFVSVSLLATILAWPVSVPALDIGASVGGRDGISAGVSADGRSGLNAGARASAGSARGVGSDASASVGGGRSVDAGVNASARGSRGVDARVNMGVGGGGLDADVSIGRTPGNANGANGITEGSSPSTTSPSSPNRGAIQNPRAVLSAFNDMSKAEQRKLLTRCRGISSAGGYDAALVSLCALLRASR